MFAVQPAPGRLALDERHHVEEMAVRGAGVVKRQNMRVLQAGRDPGRAANDKSGSGSAFNVVAFGLHALLP